VLQSTYQPLARPLFIYVNAQKAQSNKDLQRFVEYYLSQAQNIVQEVGYIPLSGEHYHLAKVYLSLTGKREQFSGTSQNSM
jgi:phosphate transport system substrate-binding protein